MYRIHIVALIRWNRVIYFILFRVHLEITDLRSCENHARKTCAHTDTSSVGEWEMARIRLDLLWCRRFWTSCLDGVFHPAPNWINRGNYLCPLVAINYKRRNVHSVTFAPIIIHHWIISITFLWKVFAFFHRRRSLSLASFFDNISSSKSIRYTHTYMYKKLMQKTKRCQSRSVVDLQFTQSLSP